MSKTHEVMFYTDGRHSSVYLYEPPMGAKQYLEPIDELVDLGIDTITYAVGDCSVLLYATKVGERWGHNVDLTDHDIWWRAAHNARLMIEQGTDPLMLVCQRAQQRGFQFLPSLLLNMIHTPHDRVTNCRVARFHHRASRMAGRRRARVPRGPLRQPQPAVLCRPRSTGQTGWR